MFLRFVYLVVYVCVFSFMKISFTSCDDYELGLGELLMFVYIMCLGFIMKVHVI